MTFDPTIPQNLPPPSVAVDQIRTNFDQYDQVFDNNHIALNATNQGKHSNVILQRQVLDPDVDGNFVSLYEKSVTSNSSTADQIFVRIPQFLPNEFPNNPMQLTFNSVSTIVPYQSFLAGGYLIFFGTIPSAITVNTTITLTPAPSQILCVIANPTKFAAVGITPTRPVILEVTLSAVNTFEFTVNSVFPGGTGDIKWLAIARA